MKIEFSGHVFEEYSNFKFDENPSSGSRVVPCGGNGVTGMTKLIVACRNFSNATENDRIIQVFRFLRFVCLSVDIMALALRSIMSL
jgi:hypothetical protein